MTERRRSSPVRFARTADLLSEYATCAYLRLTSPLPIGSPGGLGGGLGALVGGVGAVEEPADLVRDGPGVGVGKGRCGSFARCLGLNPVGERRERVRGDGPDARIGRPRRPPGRSGA